MVVGGVRSRIARTQGESVNTVGGSRPLASEGMSWWPLLYLPVQVEIILTATGPEVRV